jgi:hypothetical protein
MDQSTEDVAAAQPTNSHCTHRISIHRRHWRCVSQAAVRAVLVVMLDVASQDANELVATDDQQLIQALSPDRPHPTFGDGVRVGRLHGRADHLDPVERHMSSNTRVNLVSRSRIRNLHAIA